MKIKLITFCVSFVIITSTIFYVHYISWQIPHGTESDMYYMWKEGERIISGENTYERTLLGDMKENKKYATQFPLFYLFSASAQILGFDEYPEWLLFWQKVFFIFNIGIAYFIFHIIYFRYKWPLFAIFSSLVWLFNRWTLDLVFISLLDFIPIFFLLISMAMFKKHKWLSLFLFSLSLATKGLAIFLVPFYLIQVWQAEEKKSVRTILLAALAIMSIPIIISLPFIFLNAQAFIKSLLFNITRNAATHFPQRSIDVFFNLTGITGRIPMIIMMILIYIFAYQKKLGLYTCTLLAMFVFLGFNTVFFRQYMCWIVPFVPLAVCEKLN